MPILIYYVCVVETRGGLVGGDRGSQVQHAAVHQARQSGQERQGQARTRLWFSRSVYSQD